MKTLLFLLFIATLFQSQANAQFFTGPVASATGGAGRAAVDPGESQFLNPASVAHLQRYYVAADLGFGDHPKTGTENTYGVLLSDGSPENLFSGSFSYIRKTETPNIGPNAGTFITSSDFAIAAAGFAYEGLAVGVGAHRLQQSLTGSGDFAQNNIHLGVLYSPVESFGVGFVAYDALGTTDSSVPQGLQLVPTFALGMHAMYEEMFRVRLDFVRPDKSNPNHRTNVLFGMESFFRKNLAIRLGNEWKETDDQSFFTAGLGFKGPKLSFDYSFQTDTRVSGGSRHLFDLWLPL